MAFQLPRFKSLLLGLLAASALTAQVDPKLATATDLLDVYKSGGGTPELLTIFDFSGSMQNIFWHANYWTDLNSDSGNSMTINTTTGVVSASHGWKHHGHGIPGRSLGYQNHDPSHHRGRSEAGKPCPSDCLEDKWFETYTRTLDIPIPWTLFRVPATLPSAGTAPVPDYFNDPKSSSSVVFDTVYTLSNLNILNGTSIGLFTYNPDYLYWLFWGNVAKAADGNSYNPTPATGVKDDRNQVPPGTVFTTSTAGLGGTYPVGGGYVIPGVYDPSGGNSATPSTTVWTDNRGTTFNNGIPAGTRAMFLKKAVLTTWLSKQDKVLWAYRFLDVSSNEQGVAPYSTNFGTGDRYLTRFKTVTSGIDASVSALQKKKPANGTPLTAALANAYAQLIETATNASVFDKFNTGIDPSPCRSSFVIIFTDGLANTDTIGPNEVAANATTAVLTEADLQALPFSSLNESAYQNFNIYSLAAVAAHGLNHGAINVGQQTTGSGNPSSWAPFHVMNRGAEGTAGRKVTTMTVGLSLAGTNTSDFTAGGKGPLLRTALYR